MAQNVRPLFLLCNDDGVHAAGIKALREAVEPYGEVFVVAPHTERSASSKAITIQLPLRLEKVEERVYGVEGTPVDCVMIALQKILPRAPDWLLSGINRGGNLGTDTLYSGTVGAAIEARIQGVPSMAISLAKEHGPWDYAASTKVVKFLLEQREILDLGDDGILNVNIPALPFEQIKGLTMTCLGHRIYDKEIIEGIDPRNRPYYWIGSPGSAHLPIKNSDCVRVKEGFVTVTVLKPEMYHHELSEQMAKSLPASFDNFVRQSGYFQ